MHFSFDLDTEPDDKADKKLLVSFFDQLEEGLKVATLAGDWNDTPLNFIGDARNHLELAWDEVAGQFDLARDVIDDIPIRRFRAAGLTGCSLRAKLYLLMEWAKRAADTASSTWKGAVRRVLQNINSILGSFVYATRVGEPIKEFKEMLENGLNDLEGGAPA